MADLLARSPLTAADHEMVEIIRTSGQNLTGLLSDILDMARIEAGEVAIETAPFDLGEMLRSACALFALKAEEKGVAVALEIAPEVDTAAACVRWSTTWCPTRSSSRSGAKCACPPSAWGKTGYA
mgnify:CR=1 FL=1